MRELAFALDQALALPWPSALLLVEQLEEIRHFDRVRAFGERIDMASLTAVAFHEPKRLRDAEHRFERLAGLLPSIDATKAEGLKLVNMDRAARGLPPVSSWDEVKE